MHITDFAENVTVADLQAAIAGPSRRGDPWATRLYAALILEYMQAKGITSMKRHDLVRAVKDDFAVKAEKAASKNGTETGADAKLLSIEEARQNFSKPLLDLFMYLCGRNPKGDLYGLCPVPLSGGLPPATAIPNSNAVDKKLQVLVQHLRVRKLSIPTLGRLLVMTGIILARSTISSQIAYVVVPESMKTSSSDTWGPTKRGGRWHPSTTNGSELLAIYPL